MRIFELQPNPRRYANLALAKPSDASVYQRFDGTSVRADWKPLEIEIADSADASDELADYALLGVIPVFSWRAVECLNEMLASHGELLPLRSRHGDFLAYNVLDVIDALDESRSRILRFRDNSIMKIDDYQFIPDRLTNAAIFKIPQLRRAFVFVSDSFVQRVERSGLEGFHFRPVWRES